ncbi:hypothetical protein YT21_24175 [Salmonella enterica subsp. enterica serovar Newport]|nr:hypothetical protein [Salmonella enterica subsp. enterica serovar Newport]
MKRPILGLLLMPLSYGAHSYTYYRAVSVEADVKIYEHPGPLHHHFSTSWPASSDDDPYSTFKRDFVLNFNPGHYLVYIERFYNLGKPLHQQAQDLVYPVMNTGAYGTIDARLELVTRHGRGAVSYTSSGNTSGNLSWEDLSASKLTCRIPNGLWWTSVSNPGETYSETTGWGFTTMYQWSPQSNESNYIEYRCKVVLKRTSLGAVKMRFAPDTLNIRGVVGSPEVRASTTLIIEPTLAAVSGYLTARTPSGVTLTRDGFPHGGGFDDDPIHVPVAGTKIGVSVAVKNTTNGENTYSVPVVLTYN